MSSILIKVINGTRERGIPCGKYEKEQLFDDKDKLVGFKVHAIEGKEVTETVTLPKDGNRVYLEQDGLTIDVITWPPRAKNPHQFRVMGDQQ